jgi:hypothetical protein
MRDRRAGCVARSHRGLGSQNGPHDSVTDRGTQRRPNPRDAMARGNHAQTPLPHLVPPPTFGGCEGFAMFNRTHLTLSALALSNRLNLGTRPLANHAGVMNGDQTLRTRRTHHDVLREGTVWYDVFPILPARYVISAVPGSFSQQQQGQPSCMSMRPGRAAVVVGVEPEPRLADLVDRPERRVEDCAPRFRPSAPSGSPGTGRRLDSEPSRLGRKPQGKPGLKRAARRAAKHAAAAPAAITGK